MKTNVFTSLNLTLFFFIIALYHPLKGFSNSESHPTENPIELGNCDNDIEPPNLLLPENISLDCFYSSQLEFDLEFILEDEGFSLEVGDNCSSDNDVQIQFLARDIIATGDCSSEFTANYTFQAIDEAGNVSTPESMIVEFTDSNYPHFGDVQIIVNGVIFDTYFFDTDDGSVAIDLSNEDIQEISEDEIGIDLGDDCDFEGSFSELIETEIDANNQEAEFIYQFCDGCGNCEEFVVEIEFPYILGCTDENACNYNPWAAEDDGSCDFVDTDGDGICDADEILGCTIEGSCNYNPNATDDDGSCTDIPEANCTECNGNALVIIDSDGDGICDANEILGCTTEGSCNYNPEATDDDGSCTDIPEENCTECNDDELILIDADGDGICDADEGCTDPEAENYDPEALDDDGSCVYEVSVSLLNITCDEEDAQVLQVTDAQSTSTLGGEATRETRTIYAFQPDDGAGIPTYEGSAWPYVLAPVGFSVDDANVTADITVSDDNILLINGWPAYQYASDGNPEDANGTFGPWFYFNPEGVRSQDACVLLSTRAQSIAKEIQVFPNPAKTSISVLINEPQSSTFTLKLLSVEGRKLYEETLFQNITSQLHNLELIGIPSGVYMLRIESTEGLFTNRIIIQK